MAPWNGFLARLRPKAYGRQPPLVLLNGLAEQPESWYRNRRVWGRYFEVHTPHLLAYDGPALHARIDAKEPVSVDYLVGELHQYVTRFVQEEKVHLVSSSLGGKVAVEFAARHPGLVNRMVLICPSGMGDKEQLPVIEGVRRGDWNAVVRSVFYRRRHADRGLVRYYREAVENRRWKKGLLRTVSGTLEHTVRGRLKEVQAPTLLLTGLKDRICDPKTAEEAARELPHGFFRAIPKCGHAPQIEKYRLVNRLVAHFLSAPAPSANPGWTQLLRG